jgi:RNA polymerase sigma-70 factor (ECF subfamily)
MTQHSPIAAWSDEWDWAQVRALCLRETRRLLGASSGAADDAAQEATIRAWRHRARCRTPARPEPWIATIARREALRTLATRTEQPVPDTDDIADTRQEEVDLLDSLDLRRAMRAMERQDKRLLIGHYWQDLPSSELATQLGLAEVTVRVRLHRIRQRLRDTLKEI